MNDSVVVVNPLGEDLFTADELRTSQLEALVNDVKAITDDRSKDKDASEETLAKLEREVRMPSSFLFLFLFFSFFLLPVRTFAFAFAFAFVLLFDVVCPKKTLKPGTPSFVRCVHKQIALYETGLARAESELSEFEPVVKSIEAKHM